MGRTSGAAAMQRSAATLRRDRDEAIENMNAATKKKLSKIEKMVGDTREANLRHYYAIGKELLEVSEDPEKYGHNAYNQLVVAMATQKRTLRKAKAFSREYTPEQLEQLINLSNEEMNFKLHWGHLDYLLILNTDKQREAWALKAVQNMWDPKTLHANIKKRYGEKGAGGRPHKLPATVHMQIRQIKEFCRNWLFKTENLWNGDETNVFANIHDEPPDDLNEIDMENLDEIIEMLPRMRELAAQMRPLAVQAKNRIKDVLEARTKAAAVQAEQEASSGKESRAIDLTNGKSKGRRRTNATA